MKKLLLGGMLLPAALAMPAQNVALFGQLYTGSADNSIYTFSSDAADASMTQVAPIAAVPNCGSVKTPDRFYCFSAENGDYGKEYRVYVYDSSADYTLVTSIGSAYNIAREGQVLAYDPSTKKIFTVYEESSYYGSDLYLGEIDLSNRSTKKIGSSLYFGYGNTKIAAMAFNPAGELYAIATNATLYKINTATADLSYVGSTGIYPEYEQSMTFSPDGSTIYWAACNDDINALYSVDPATAKATKIKDFANGEEFVTLWAGEAEAAPGAPGAVTDIKADFPAGALSGTVSFTAPAITHSGEPLEGDITYTVTADDQELATGTAAAAEKVNCSITVAAAGTYEFKIVASNAEGAGDVASLAPFYIGLDVPMQVENLSLTRGDEADTFIVAWDTPATGAHGGYVDQAQIKFRVQRLPEFTLLSEYATSPFTDRFTSDKPVKCRYEVTPYIDATTSGLPATTQFIMVGKPYEVPYTSDFETPSAANEWTVVDANSDGHSWEYQWDFGYYRIYDNENPKDDWLVSPYVGLSPEYEYRLSYKVRTIATEQLEVKMGLGMNPSELSITLKDTETIPDTNYDWEDRELTFTCPAAGNYHFGFHAATANPDEGLALYVKDVKVEKTGHTGASEAVAADADFIIAAGAAVALRATTITVSAVDGRRIARTALQPGESLPLPAGLHIVSSPATTRKVVL